MKHTIIVAMLLALPAAPALAQQAKLAAGNLCIQLSAASQVNGTILYAQQ